ncbi:hypothetical protein CDD81_6439 [Ophiocordyceps australis]|uniref:Uncharacterized protein n=1 Tax=Ophiocordyceps australis TaxID=1399860 RepID=A0A2C5YH30_9HYPO|nr:hypothetical protein CDD81_6439 [Ophiocordyceps australis]
MRRPRFEMSQRQTIDASSKKTFRPKNPYLSHQKTPDRAWYLEGWGKKPKPSPDGNKESWWRIHLGLALQEAPTMDNEPSRASRYAEAEANRILSSNKKHYAAHDKEPLDSKYEVQQGKFLPEPHPTDSYGQHQGPPSPSFQRPPSSSFDLPPTAQLQRQLLQKRAGSDFDSVDEAMADDTDSIRNLMRMENQWKLPSRSRNRHPLPLREEEATKNDYQENTTTSRLPTNKKPA